MNSANFSSSGNESYFPNSDEHFLSQTPSAILKEAIAAISVIAVDVT